MDDYLSKPIRGSDLRDKLARWTPERTGRAERATQGGRTTRGDDRGVLRAAGGAGAPALDVATALSRMEGDRELLGITLNAFLETIPGLMEALDGAISDADAEGLARAAHTLKGGAASICAEPVRRVAERFEQLGAQQEFQIARDLFQSLDGSIDQVRRAIAAFDRSEHA
jgi:HPt (histidine-containing phosphotransfer) domain-containing protein